MPIAPARTLMRCNLVTAFTVLFANWLLAPAFADPMTQIPAVSELSDVQPNDWAYEALRSLTEKYGCIDGYPDRTYRGERFLTRYEFAAGLDSCLQKIEALTISGVNIAREDLTQLQRLSKDFASELSTLQGRVDGLEGRVAVLEDNQFSTTTKLSGEVIFAVSSAFGDRKADSNESVDENVVISDRVRLFFNTSFTGKDSLGLEIEAGNTPNLREATGTNMARLGFDQGSDNDLALSFLAYQFPVSDAADAAIILNANFFDFVDVINPDVGSDRRGGVSRFGVRSPIYRLVNGGSGASFSYDFGDFANLTLMYLSSDASDPELGLFGGSYAALGQLSLTPSDSVGIGLTYAHSYNALSSGTGSNNANEPFGDASDAISA
ncbi:MAG: iron uptake porin, partial [Hydrococcus sp. Prado102]|nr:iron uptake porin [Hydrococcus sp. Prado102]